MTVSSLVMLTTVSSNWFHTLDRSKVSRMVYGTADRPYVYRVLTPFTIRVLAYLTPDGVRQRIEDKWHQIGRLQNIGPKQGLEEGYVLEYAYALALMYGSLIGFAFIFRALAGSLFHAPPLVTVFAPVIVVGLLPIFSSIYLYDFPNLLLFSSCPLLLYRRNWAWFYPVFIATCFSKETSLLLVVITAVYFFDTDRKTFWRHGIIQGAIWLCITAFVRYLFRDNPGSVTEFHLLDHNLGLLLNPASYFAFDSLLLPRGLNLGLMALAAALIVVDWREKPLFLRRALLILPLLLASMLLWGYFEEIRSLLEVWPIVALLALPNVTKIFDVPISQSGPPAEQLGMSGSPI